MKRAGTAENKCQLEEMDALKKEVEGYITDASVIFINNKVFEPDLTHLIGTRISANAQVGCLILTSDVFNVVSACRLAAVSRKDVTDYLVRLVSLAESLRCYCYCLR